MLLEEPSLEMAVEVAKLTAASHERASAIRHPHPKADVLLSTKV